MGQFVRCIWSDEHRKYFVATITKFRPRSNTYDVYFLEDHSKLTSVNGSDIKTCEDVVVSHSDHLIGEKFFDTGSKKTLGDNDDFNSGEFVIKSIKKTRKSYVYMCERVVFDDNDIEDLSEFNMNYVMERVRSYKEE